MDAIRKIEAALKKMPGDGPWRPEHRDALNEWRALMNEANIREVLQTLAGKEAELAEAGLKYVSLFGELQNAMEEIARLKSALNGMLTHMGMDEDEWNKPTFDQARAALRGNQ